jgi:hypothetical protein
MAKLRPVKGQVEPGDVDLRARLANAIADGLTLGEIARITGLSETTLTNVRDATRPGMRRNTRDGLRRLASLQGVSSGQGPSSAQVGAAPPQPVGYVTQPGVSTTQPPKFLTEAERTAYTLGVLHATSVSATEALRGIYAARDSLLTPIAPLTPAYPDTEETRQAREAARRAGEAGDAASPSRQRRRA